MSWIHKLYDTYEAAQGNSLLDDQGRRPLPVGHIFAAVHIEVTLNAAGDFVTARILDKTEAQTCIPCTVDSGSRSGSKPPPHPLADKLQYAAGDFRAFGGKVTIGFQNEEDRPHKDYVDGLRQWVEAFPHPRLKAILAYAEKGCLIADLRDKAPRVIPFDTDSHFATSASKEEKELWPIWKSLGPSSTPQDAVVRWRVELAPGDTDANTWESPDLLQGWSDYYPATLGNPEVCTVSGKPSPLTGKHPRGLRNSADGAKLISSNDKHGFTFRGRFEGGDEAISVGYAVSQKAHNALRWLIDGQGRSTRHGDQVFVAWAVSGKTIPQSFGSLDDWEPWDDDAPEKPEAIPDDASTDHTRDLGQSYARRLNKYMAGYGDIDDPTEDIVIMGLDSASPGRLSIIYYREIKGSELLERLRRWHTAMAWPQRFTRKEPDATGKAKPRTIWATAAPAPDTIAETAHGHRLDDRLRKATIERLIPCIIEGRPLPRDLMESCIRRAAHRSGLENWEWELALGVACALFKGFFATHPDPHQRRSYAMTLETTRTDRDYLFGRLLAIAENIEQQALYYAGEKRPTNAERLMQHFADRPFSAWRTLELALDPYLKRLQSRAPGLLKIRKDLLDDVLGLFRHDDFTRDERLSGEFLLGYHCQRLDFRYKPSAETTSDAEGDKE
jgi:CRISPR-associated protein Csd1